MKKIKPLLCNIKSMPAHAKLVHGSNYNKSKFKRPLMLLGFIADAWPLMGINDYNKFKNNIVLGKHINEPRLSDNHAAMLYQFQEMKDQFMKTKKTLNIDILNKLNV